MRESIFLKKVYFCYLILHVFARLYSAAELDGKFGLQDFEEDVHINFSGKSLSISDLHRDLYEKEREFKGKEKGATNFLLAKVGIYKNDGTCFERGLHLHEMMGELKPYVFHSASIKKTNITDHCTNCNLSASSVPSIDLMEKIYRTNAVKRGIFPGIRQNSIKEDGTEKLDGFESVVENTKIGEQPVLNARQDLAREAKIYASELSDLYQYGLMPETIEKNMQQLRKKFKDAEKKFSEADLSKFVKYFWHSEPRLLSFFYTNEIIPVFLRGMARALTGQVDLILLHMHSTHDICDNCRLQLTGGTYKWLYEKMVSFFMNGSEGVSPVFHLIVSWADKPRSKIDFKNIKEGVTGININDVASIEDTRKLFSEDTKPFVSIVKLGSSISSVAGSLEVIENEGKK